LREYENSRRFPLSRLPVLPVACLGVDIIVINSFFVEVGTLSRDLRKSGVYALENFLVELLTIIGLEKTTNRPGE
jgi:hypothetical protein